MQRLTVARRRAQAAQAARLLPRLLLQLRATVHPQRLLAAHPQMQAKQQLPAAQARLSAVVLALAEELVQPQLLYLPQVPSRGRLRRRLAVQLGGDPARQHAVAHGEAAALLSPRSQQPMVMVTGMTRIRTGTARARLWAVKAEAAASAPPAPALVPAAARA